jgi:hypothetical protein
MHVQILSFNSEGFNYANNFTLVVHNWRTTRSGRNRRGDLQPVFWIVPDR